MADSLSAVAQQFLGAGGVPDQPQFQASSQFTFPANLPAVSTRHIMKWLVPEQPIIQMYVNPENIQITEQKAISTKRTKGGYISQYWGMELGKMQLRGTTGTSGIEGLNVLYSAYINEQNIIDASNLLLVAQQNQTSLGNLGTNVGSSVGGALGGAIGGAVGGLLSGAIDSSNPNPSMPSPSLAQLAFTVQCYYCGVVYRGWYTNFSYTESIEKLGLFEYNIDFTYSSKAGNRENFLAWHRSPNFGPSNNDVVPHSFSQLVGM